MSRSRQTREIVASPYTATMATTMVTDQTARRRSGLRPLVAVIAAVLAGFGLASIVIWVVDAAGPTRTVSAADLRRQRSSGPIQRCSCSSMDLRSAGVRPAGYHSEFGSRSAGRSRYT